MKIIYDKSSFSKASKPSKKRPLLLESGFAIPLLISITKSRINHANMTCQCVKYILVSSTILSYPAPRERLGKDWLYTRAESSANPSTNMYIVRPDSPTRETKNPVVPAVPAVIEKDYRRRRSSPTISPWSAARMLKKKKGDSVRDQILVFSHVCLTPSLYANQPWSQICQCRALCLFIFRFTLSAPSWVCVVSLAPRVPGTWS